MKINEITATRNKKPARRGRGISAGRGKTAGRGTKGQGSRKSSLRQGFSGGQTPLYMQLPKLRGFKSKKTATEIIKVGQLDQVKASVVDPVSLADSGIISSPYARVKVIAGGELKSKKTVKVERASAAAIKAVEAAGGKYEFTPRLARVGKSVNDAK